MTKSLNLLFALAVVSLVGCGGKSGRKTYTPPVTTGFGVAVTTSQTPTGDLLLTIARTGGATGEVIQTLNITAEKELSNGQRVAVPFSFESQPANTIRILGTSLTDAVRVHVQVEAISNLGNRATATVTLSGFGFRVDFDPHPSNGNMLQVRITRNDNAALPQRFLDVVTMNSQGTLVKTLFTNQVLGINGLQSVALVDPTIERRLRITVWNLDSSSTAVIELDVQLGQSTQTVQLQQ
jgi:hypothetical protein